MYEQRLDNVKSLRCAVELTPFYSPFKRKKANQPAFDVIKPVQKYPKSVDGPCNVSPFCCRLKYEGDIREVLAVVGLRGEVGEVGIRGVFLGIDLSVFTNNLPLHHTATILPN